MGNPANERVLTVGLLSFCSLLLGTFGAMAAPIYFVERSAEVGLDFVQVNGSPVKEYIVEAKGAGVSVVDVNGDEWDDIYFINGADVHGRRGPDSPRNALYLNNGDGTFRDATEEYGLGDPGFGTGATFADYDGDGDLDVYLTNFGLNQLYRNDGGKYVLVPNAGGAQVDGWSTGAAFGDLDGDGDLDLYVSNYAYFSTEIAERKGKMADFFGKLAFIGPASFEPAPDHLFVNNGDGTFRDVTEERGIVPLSNGRGFTVTMTDLDDDGDLDIYVSNDSTGNHLYMNDGRGYFEEFSLEYCVGLSESGKAQGSMGVAARDYDGDLDIDLLVVDYDWEQNVLYRNDGDIFTEVSLETNVGWPSQRRVSFGALMEDFDNDGWPDIHVSTGHVYPVADELTGFQGYAQLPLFHLNNGDGTFTEITANSGPGMAVRGVSRGSAVADFDDDGDLDIIINNLDGRPYYLENRSTVGNWFQLLLQDRNAMPAYGARAVISFGGRKILRELRSAASFLSQNSAVFHYGLGESTTVDEVRIRWPDGSTQVLTNLPANKRLTVQQGKEQPAS